MDTFVLFLFIICLNFAVFFLYLISAFYVIYKLKFDLDVVSRLVIGCYLFGILVRIVNISIVMAKKWDLKS